MKVAHHVMQIFSRSKDLKIFFKNAKELYSIKEKIFLKAKL